MVPVHHTVTLVVGIDSPGGLFLPKFSLIINGVTKLVFSLATIFPNEYKSHLLFSEIPMFRNFTLPSEILFLLKWQG